MIKPLIITFIAFFTSACASVKADNVKTLPNSLAEILGDWDVVSFDKFQPFRLDSSGERNAYVDIGETHISFRMTCNFSGISAVLNDEARLVKAPNNSGIRSVMGCGEESPEKDFFAMMYNAPLVEILSNDRLRLSTKRHEVILEKSELRRLMNSPKSLDEITGDWNVMSVHIGGRGSFGGLGSATKKVSITHQEIQYGDCYPKIELPKIRPDLGNQLIGTPLMPSIGAGAQTCPKKTMAEIVLLNLLRRGSEIEWTMSGDLKLANGHDSIMLTQNDRW